MKHTIQLLSIVAACTIGACNKIDPVPMVDGELVNYFNYKEGTYWVMRDSLTGREDSFFITNYSRTTEHNFSIRGGNSGAEVIRYTLKQQSLTPGQLKDSFSTDYLMYEGVIAKTTTHAWAISSMGINFNYNTIANFPLKERDTLWCADNTPTSWFYNTCSQLPQATVAGTSYTDAIQLTSSFASADTSQPYTFSESCLYSKTSGYLRISTNHPTDSFQHIWLVSRWHINR